MATGIATARLDVCLDDPSSGLGARVLRRLSLDEHVPQPLTSDLVGESDLLVVMELAQLRTVRAMFPDRAASVVLLSLFDEAAAGPYERCNIEDPFGQPAARYTYCYERVARATDGLLDALGVPVVDSASPAS